jgi:hypothetical protein
MKHAQANQYLDLSVFRKGRKIEPLTSPDPVTHQGAMGVIMT